MMNSEWREKISKTNEFINSFHPCSHGRNKGLTYIDFLSEKTQEHILNLYENNFSVRSILEILNLDCSFSSLRRYLKNKKKIRSERSELMKSSYANGKREGHEKYSFGKIGYRNDLGLFVRSSWEANFVRILRYCGIEFIYEWKRFKIFDSDGKLIATYLPDFYIPDINLIIEVKGYISEKSMFRVNLFRNLYPEFRVLILDGEKYNRQKDIFSKYIPKWEY